MAAEGQRKALRGLRPQGSGAPKALRLGGSPTATEGDALDLTARKGSKMTVSELGRLERVDLREIWVSEASDFTPWLARKENLDILADTLGLELELQAQEQRVGPFRADILCKDIGSDGLVLIENQLGTPIILISANSSPMHRDLRP